MDAPTDAQAPVTKTLNLEDGASKAWALRRGPQPIAFNLQFKPNNLSAFGRAGQNILLTTCELFWAVANAENRDYR